MWVLVPFKTRAIFFSSRSLVEDRNIGKAPSMQNALIYQIWDIFRSAIFSGSFFLLSLSKIRNNEEVFVYIIIVGSFREVP